MNEIELKDIYHDFGDVNQELVYKWDFVDIDEDLRLFYKRVIYNDNYEDLTGFYFCLVSATGKTEELWADDWYCEVFYTGIAYFDGIRHLYLGSKQTQNYGYDYYPSCKKHIKAMKALAELEKKYCRDLD